MGHNLQLGKRGTSHVPDNADEMFYIMQFWIAGA